MDSNENIPEGLMTSEEVANVLINLFDLHEKKEVMAIELFLDRWELEIRYDEKQNNNNLKKTKQ